mmetsp:Transcript_14899/g.62006  ORF Transcript_14899/g.62006 Transcript_14899/m.62006 type:complete len:352 (+) Transcript_14899:145-1200(+)
MSRSQSGMPLPEARRRPSRRNTRKQSSPRPTPSVLLCSSSTKRSHSESDAAGGSARKRRLACSLARAAAAATLASKSSSAPPPAPPSFAAAAAASASSASVRAAGRSSGATRSVSFLALAPKPLRCCSSSAVELPMTNGTSTSPRSSSFALYLPAAATAARTLLSEPASTTGRALERRSHSCTMRSLLPPEPTATGSRERVSSTVRVSTSLASPSWSRRHRKKIAVRPATLMPRFCRTPNSVTPSSPDSAAPSRGSVKRVDRKAARPSATYRKPRTGRKGERASLISFRSRRKEPPSALPPSTTSALSAANSAVPRSVARSASARMVLYRRPQSSASRRASTASSLCSKDA